MITRHEWASGYLEQAKSDLDARAVLCVSPHLPVCHELHFLQMACEKLAKGYLCRNGSNPEDLQTSHAYLAKVLPVIFREYFIRRRNLPTRRDSWIMKHIHPGG